MAQPEWKEVGHVGDVNWPEYDGGPVLVDETGVYPPELEYVITPEEDYDKPRARWEIYRVVLDQEVPSWGELEAVAESAGQDPDDLREAFESDDPMERAWAYVTWAGHYGWVEFDQEPLSLTRLEVEKRYDTDLGGRSGIISALEEVVERMADESQAEAWSSPGDQMLSDIADGGYDSDSAVVLAEFGDALAVNGDLLVDRGWEERLGLKPGKHPRLWNEVGSHQLEGWLEQNGYELTDFGGRVPASEGYASGEHAAQAVAKDMKLPVETIEEVARSLDWWQEEIPHGTSGDSSVWARRKAAADESRRHSARDAAPMPGGERPAPRWAARIVVVEGDARHPWTAKVYDRSGHVRSGVNHRNRGYVEKWIEMYFPGVPVEFQSSTAPAGLPQRRVRDGGRAAVPARVGPTWVPPVLAREGITPIMLEVLLDGMGEHAHIRPGQSVVLDQSGYRPLREGGYIVLRHGIPGLSSLSDYFVLTDKGADVVNRWRAEVRKIGTPTRPQTIPTTNRRPAGRRRRTSARRR